jgi:ferric-dicitrate binding protein FerR (iron transport regulator)
MKEDDIERLVIEVLDGTASFRQCEELSKVLAADPAALEIYCRCCEMDSALQRLAAGRSGLTAATLDPDDAAGRRPVRTALLAAVAAVAVAAAGLWFVQAPQPEALVVFAQGPATLFSVEHSGESDAVGNQLAENSVVRLSQGGMELRFRNGVIATIEAPAEWVIKSAERMELRRGSAWFAVPAKARGFQVSSPELEVVDLGTEFGVLVEAGRSDQVHVMKGSVAVRHRAAAEGSRALVVMAGEAVSANPRQKVDSIRYDAAMFARSLPAELPALHWPFDERQADGWPAVGKHLDFDAAAVRLTGEAEIVDGPVGKALRLKPSQFLESQWPGILDARPRTIAGWIRVEKGLPDAELPTSIVFWGKEGNELSMMKWRVGLNAEAEKEGGVKGALRTEFGLGRVIGSTDLRDGRWHHIAAVFQGGNTSDNTRRVLLYVDGQLEALSSSAHQRISTRSASPLQFGGRGGRFDLDDFRVIEGALSAEDIAALASRDGG